MNVYKIIFSGLLTLWAAQSMAGVDWSKVPCPKEHDAYIAEAMSLIVSGYTSNPQSVCLKQENYKYFDLSLIDPGEGTPNPTILSSDYKYKIIGQNVGKLGTLYVVYEITNAKKTVSGKFSLYFNGEETGFSEKGCAAFYDTPSNSYLKKECVKDKSK